jgi:uncharacterized protein (TIGR03084 family)
MNPVPDLVADLAAETAALDAFVADLGRDDWLAPTPAWQWDVRDSVAHLADTDEIASDTCTGGPRPLAACVAAARSAEDVTFAGVRRGRRLSPDGVLAWWRRARARMIEVLAGLEPSARVPWGRGMSAPAFVTARLMETWAHGLDVHAALGRAPVDTDRLAHVAWLGVRSLPYACSVAGEPPLGPLRIELTLPSGAPWTAGPEDAPDRITGTVAAFARVCVQRRAPGARGLEADGDEAHRALRVARCFL